MSLNKYFRFRSVFFTSLPLHITGSESPSAVIVVYNSYSCRYTNKQTNNINSQLLFLEHTHIAKRTIINTNFNHNYTNIFCEKNNFFACLTAVCKKVQDICWPHRK